MSIHQIWIQLIIRQRHWIVNWWIETFPMELNGSSLTQLIQWRIAQSTSYLSYLNRHHCREPTVLINIATHFYFIGKESTDGSDGTKTMGTEPHSERMRLKKHYSNFIVWHSLRTEQVPSNIFSAFFYCQKSILIVRCLYYSFELYYKSKWKNNVCR